MWSKITGIFCGYKKQIAILKMKNADLENAYYGQVQLNKELAEDQMSFLQAIQCCCSVQTRQEIERFITIKHLEKCSQLDCAK